MAIDFVSRLHDAGLRVTEQRLAALAEVEKNGHISAEDLRQCVASKTGSISTQAIYDIVHTLTSVGILREIKPNGSVALYEIETGDNHHHLVCRSCQRLEVVPCAVGYVPCLQAHIDHGFDIDEAEVIYWGLCPSCRS